MENSRPLLLSPEILVLSEVKLSGYFFHYGPIPLSLLFALSALPAWLASRHLAENLNEHWGGRKNVLAQKVTPGLPLPGSASCGCYSLLNLPHGILYVARR